MTPTPIRQRTWLLARIFFAFWFVSSVLHSGSAGAQANVYRSDKNWSGDGACQTYIGGQLVHFHMYQAPKRQDFERQTNYYAASLEQSNCTDLPATGPAIFTVDLVGRKLRETPVSLKIIDPLADGPSKLVVNHPPQVYPRGIIETYPNFVRPGQYHAVLTYSDHSLPEQQITLFVAERRSLFSLRDVLGVLLIALAGTLATGEITRLLRSDE